jgi:hypothetical protein
MSPRVLAVFVWRMPLSVLGLRCVTYSSRKGTLSHLDEFLQHVYNVRVTSFLSVELAAWP